jgi:hypothetical protein
VTRPTSSNTTHKVSLSPSPHSPCLICGSEKCISINANLYNSSKYRLCPSEFHPFSPPTAAATRYPQVVDTSLVHDDHPDPQIYCRYRSLASDYAVPAPTPATASDNGTNSGEKNENSKIPICLDVKGQLLTETSIIRSLPLHSSPLSSWRFPPL